MSAAVVGLEPGFAADMLRGLANTPLRVVRVDGVNQGVTMDYVEDRVNVAVQNGKITSIVNFG
jgi:hypothetical protein